MKLLFIMGIIAHFSLDNRVFISYNCNVVNVFCTHTSKTRVESFRELFPTQPAFRLQQIKQALFDVRNRSWNDVSALPKQMRETLEKEVPWMSVRAIKIFTSARKDTHKAVLEMNDDLRVESVLMKNARGQWTICVSSQAGCAMKCAFCATGKMGLSRSLTSDEITDQYRLWQTFLHTHPEITGRISNVVFMGMGEPLANYMAVRDAISCWLAHTDVGPTHITVSTVGVLPLLEKLTDDPTWPHVRIAISLHSADPVTRKKIVPSSYDDFLPRLREWARTYLAQVAGRRNHITFEYVMLSGVNDTLMHANKLAMYANSIGQVRVNLIPYNFTADSGFVKSSDEQVKKFVAILEAHDVTTMVRRTMGDDIAAACGQLITGQQHGN